MVVIASKPSKIRLSAAMIRLPPCEDPSRRTPPATTTKTTITTTTGPTFAPSNISHQLSNSWISQYVGHAERHEQKLFGQLSEIPIVVQHLTDLLQVHVLQPLEHIEFQTTTVMDCISQKSVVSTWQPHSVQRARQRLWALTFHQR